MPEEYRMYLQNAGYSVTAGIKHMTDLLLNMAFLRFVELFDVSSHSLTGAS